jgi:hypothetical protein
MMTYTKLYSQEATIAAQRKVQIALYSNIIYYLNQMKYKIKIFIIILKNISKKN